MKDESFVSLYHLHMCFHSLNAGRTALPTDPRKNRAVQERSSEVIFGTVYSHRASTIPGSLLLSPALTLFVCAVLFSTTLLYTKKRVKSMHHFRHSNALFRTGKGPILSNTFLMSGYSSLPGTRS